MLNCLTVRKKFVKKKAEYPFNMYTFIPSSYCEVPRKKEEKVDVFKNSQRIAKFSCSVFTSVWTKTV